MERKNRDKNYSKLYHPIVRNGFLRVMTGSEAKVYLALLSHVDDRTRKCWPSIKLISEESGVSLKRIPKITEKLSKKGLIKKWRHGPKNFYYLQREDKLKYLFPQNAELSEPKKPCKLLRNGEGKFTSPQNAEALLPQNVESMIPCDAEVNKNHTKTNKKKESIKNLFIHNSMKEEKSLNRFSKEDIQAFKKSLGKDGLRVYLINQNYPVEEINKLLEDS